MKDFLELVGVVFCLIAWAVVVLASLALPVVLIWYLVTH